MLNTFGLYIYVLSFYILDLFSKSLDSTSVYSIVYDDTRYGT